MIDKLNEFLKSNGLKPTAMHGTRNHVTVIYEANQIIPIDVFNELYEHAKNSNIAIANIRKINNTYAIIYRVIR